MKWVDTPDEDLTYYETDKVRKLKRAYRIKPSQRLEELIKKEYIRELYDRLNN